MAPLLLVGLVWSLAAPGPQAKVQAPAATRDTRPAPAAGTASITGTVVAADTGRPVRRVQVTLSSAPPALTLSVTTAEDGQFTFKDLPAGSFALSAAKPGFIESVFGEKQPGSGRPGTPIPLLESQKLDRLSLPLARGGVLTGTVTDEAGDPSFGAQVRALRWVMRTGERALTVAGMAVTDDRGIYRIPGLLAGDYLISAVSTDTPSDDRADAAKKRLAEVSAAGDVTGAAMQQLKTALASLAEPADPSKDAPAGYAPVYFPGTTQPTAAQTVSLGVSEERQGVDLALQLVPLVRVSGIVTGTAGPVGAAQVVLAPTNTPVPTPGPRTTRIGPDGRFAFVGVPPGAYTVLATTGEAGMVMMKMAADKASLAVGKDPGASEFSQLWALTDVVSDGRPLAPLVLALGSGLTLGGRIVTSGASTPPDWSRVRVFVSAASAASPERSAQVPAGLADPAGHFAVTGLVPGHYRLTVSGTAAWSVASAVVGGRDVMDVPLEVKPGDDLGAMVVTLTDRTTTISGTLTNASGQPAPGYTIVIFPGEQAFWQPQARRIQAVRPGIDGRYIVQGLPAGDYRVAVVPDVEPGTWYDPAWLRSILPAALTVSLTDGQHLVQDVRVR